MGRKKFKDEWKTDNWKKFLTLGGLDLSSYITQCNMLLKCTEFFILDRNLTLLKISLVKWG